MKLIAKGLRSIVAAEIDIEPGITLICGANGSGKTTLAKAIGAALTRDGKLGLASKEARGAWMVADGVKAGLVQLGVVAAADRDESMVGVKWPDGEVTTTGDLPPHATRIPAGLDKPGPAAPRDRAAMLTAALRADPTEREWLAACATAEIGAKTADTRWTLIDSDGWDAAAKRWADEAREWKGRWCQITGARAYQPEAAATWQAPDFEGEDLMKADVAALDDAVDGRRRQRDDALRHEAVGAAERQDLEAKAADLDEVARQLEDFRLEVESLSSIAVGWDSKLQKVEVGRPTCPCPHCAAPIEIWPESDQNGPPLRRLSRGLRVDPTTVAEWRARRSEAKGELEKGLAKRSSLEAFHRTAQEAAAKLATLPPLQPERLAQAERELDAAIQRRDAVATTQNARTAWQRIEGLGRLIQLAGPTGLRKSKLAATLELFNNKLAEFSTAAGWARAVIDVDLAITAGGRAYASLSESEQWRVDALIACAVAFYDSSEVVVMDRSDCLDGRGRNGLVTLAGLCGVAVVCCMTAPRSQVQMLADAGYPVWLIQSGQVARVNATTVVEQLRGAA